MLKDYFKLALNSLVHKKVRSWLTLLGIFIGVAAVVSLIGLGEGLRTAISSQFGVASTEVLTIQAGGMAAAGPPGTGVINPLTEEDGDAIERLSVIEHSITRTMEFGKFEYRDEVVYGMTIDMPGGDKRKLVDELLDIQIEKGRWLKDGDSNKVILGYNFYSGEVTGDVIEVGDSVYVQDKKFTVVGITEKKGSFIFDNIVWMNNQPLKDLFESDDSVDVIVAKVKSKDLMDDAKEDIDKLLRKRRDVKVGEEDFTVQTPDAALSSLDNVLKGVQVFVVMIASISIIIGSIGIVNTMLTSVMERKSEIGTMKSLGSKNSDIFWIFFFESGLMGMIGGIVGVIIGTFISYVGTVGINTWVNATSEPQINWILIGGTLFGSFLIGSLAGIMPALKAAKLNPVDALRG